jgi:exocyst complex component 4
MHLFTQISLELDFSRNKIHKTRDNLQSCKQLLRCRREELKKLYTDAVKNKRVLEYLDHINELRNVNSTKFNSSLQRRHYLKATKMLMSAIDISKKQLREVEGLDDLRQDFENKKLHLYNKLVEEMNRHIYHSSTTEVLNNFQRNNSARISSNHLQSTPFQRNTVRKSADRIEANNKAKKALQEITQNGFIDRDLEVIDDISLLDPEINSTYFIGIIVECFALLNKVPDSVETMKVQMQFELLAIVEKTTAYILDTRQRNAIAGQKMLENGETHIDVPFLELLDLLFKQFQLIAEAHQLSLKNYGSVIKRHQLQIKPYDLTDFWGQVQAVLQLLLTDYLDIQNTGDDELRMSFPDQQVNINTFFGRRKNISKKSLFRFDKSSHTIDSASGAATTSNSLEIGAARGHMRNLSNVSTSSAKDIITSISGKKRREKLFVCKPDPSLIRKIFIPMLAYIHTIESNANMKKNGQVSSLHDFLTTYVKESFLSRGHNRNLSMTIESLSKSQDAWKAIITADEMKKLSLNRPLLQSCRVVENLIAETKQLIQDLPSFHDDMLKNVCMLLKTYRETCQNAYRGIVQPETEDKRIYSVAWLKDEDISRFLKTLPNYLDLKTANAKAKQKKIKIPEMSMDEDSPTQIQQRNIKEAEMLTSNLGDGGISQHEILSDIGVLKELAILQESMEWFAYRINEFAMDLKRPINCVSKSSTNVSLPAELVQPITIKDGTIKVLTNLALEFDELANICLLVLHLEVK